MRPHAVRRIDDGRHHGVAQRAVSPVQMGSFMIHHVLKLGVTVLRSQRGVPGSKRFVKSNLSIASLPRTHWNL